MRNPFEENGKNARRRREAEVARVKAGGAKISGSRGTIYLHDPSRHQAGFFGWLLVASPEGEQHLVFVPLRKRADHSKWSGLVDDYSGKGYGFGHPRLPEWLVVSDEARTRARRESDGPGKPFDRGVACTHSGFVGVHPHCFNLQSFNGDESSAWQYACRLQTKFARLLGAGWRVVDQFGWNFPAELADDYYWRWVREYKSYKPPTSQRQEAKKGTDKVAHPGTKTSQKSHGGDNASKEVKDSPNEAKGGEQDKRTSLNAGNIQQGEAPSPVGAGDKEKTKTGQGAAGGKTQEEAPKKTRRSKRGGRSKKVETKKAPPKKKEVPPEVKLAKQTGHQPVIVMAKRMSPLSLENCQQAANVLKELVGRCSQKKIQYGTKIWEQEFLMALETGEDPIPYLDKPATKRNSKILITPDCSGSCQGWSGLARAFAAHMVKVPDLEVIFISNANGEFFLKNDNTVISLEAIKKVYGEFDFVFYLGDGDGWQTMTTFAKGGAKVVMFDSYSARAEKPRLDVEVVGNGCIYHVWSVSTQSVATWVKGLELVRQAWVQ